VRDVSSKLTRSEEPQVSCFQVYRFSLCLYTYIAFFKKMKACLTEDVLFSSGGRELFQSTPLRTKTVPVAVELSLSPVQEHGDKSNSL